MADENLSAIDDESKAMLEDHVKKGKARKFILITKGAAIKSLIVFKKGPYGPKINKAKKDGFRGEATCGVITGKGVNITFQLPGTAEVSSAMKAEGNVYEGEPCKIAKLRAFFADEADLKFKPEFDIVKSLDKVATVSELDDETEENVAEVAAGDVDVAERKQKLVEVLKKLTALIQQAVAAQPQRKNEILQPAATIKEHLQANRLDEARQGLLEYNGFLNEVIGTGSTASNVPPSPPPPPPPQGDTASAKESEWDWRSKELSPKLKQVLGEKKGDFGHAAALYKKALAAKTQDIGQAVDLLKQCAHVVDLALSAGGDEGGEGQLGQQLAELRAAISPRVKPFLADHPEAKSELVRLLGVANKSQESGQFAEAIEAFRAIQAVIDHETHASEGRVEDPETTGQTTGQDTAQTTGQDTESALDEIESLADEIGNDIDAGLADEQEMDAEFETALKALQSSSESLQRFASKSEGGDESPTTTDGQSPAETSGNGGISLVKLGKSRLEWDAVRLHAIREIQRLKGILREEYDGIDDELAALSKAEQRLNSVIIAMNEELGDRLDELLNAESAKRSSFVTAAKSVLSRLVSTVDTDPLLTVIDGNEYAPDMRVAAPMREQLHEIASHLN